MSEDVNAALGIGGTSRPTTKQYTEGYPEGFVRSRPTADHVKSEPIADSEGRSKYPALRFVSSVLKLFGWIAVILGFICVIAGLASLGASRDSVTYGFTAATGIMSVGLGFSTILMGLITAAIGEAAHVLMDIEANTRK